VARKSSRPSPSPDGARKGESSPEPTSDKTWFKIGEVADIVGVEAYVLRYWESEKLLRPEKMRSGQRLYRQKDIDAAVEVKRLLHGQGYRIDGARKKLRAREADDDPGQVEAAQIAAASASETARAALSALNAIAVEIAALEKIVDEDENL
jgi:DNA-binding transcriptional MerR regulator